MRLSFKVELLCSAQKKYVPCCEKSMDVRVVLNAPLGQQYFDFMGSSGSFLETIYRRVGEPIPKGWCSIGSKMFCPDHYSQAEAELIKEWRYNDELNGKT